MGDESIVYMGLNLVAEDVEATVDFYRLLGVSVPEASVWRSETGAHHVADVDVGGTGVLEFDSTVLAREYVAESRDALPATIIGFKVSTRDAVDALHHKIVAAGHPSRQAPYDAFWGARYAVVADPDGRDVGLMSPIDADMRSTPPTI